MKRQKMSYEAERGIIIMLAVLFFISLIWGISWIVSQESEESKSCEAQGGHVYSRQVGKIHYHKCVTDDNQVIVQ